MIVLLWQEVNKKLNQIEELNKYMCGIVAGISRKNILPPLLNGLEKLEYRGYDSCGAAILKDGEIAVVKTVAKVASLREELVQGDKQSNIAMLHTRWATHGAPSIANAHPHFTDEVAIVHNGIIENYLELKQELERVGYIFNTETDSEVVAKLLDYYFTQNKDPAKASEQTISRLKGSYALVFIFKGHKLLFAAVDKNPLVIGIADDAIYIASDMLAFGKDVQKVVYLEDGDKTIVGLEYYSISDRNGQLVERKLKPYILAEDVSKKSFEHFMLKEIHEQPAVLKSALDYYLKTGSLDNIGVDWRSLKNIKIIACGSAYHSGLVAKYWLESIADLNTEVEIASEYRYRKAPFREDCLTIVVSQSGETLDTLEALKKAKAHGQKILAIINNENSSIARFADYVMPIMVGREIGVASTKAFLGQLLAFALLTLHIFRVKEQQLGVASERYQKLLDQLLNIPAVLLGILEEKELVIRKIAEEIQDFPNVLFIARGELYPIALEGALKLKELSYIHAAGYAGGELKHGSIALVDDKMLVIAILAGNELFNKMFSNVQEVVARGANVLAITNGDDGDNLARYSKWLLKINMQGEFLAPISSTLILQLIAYYVASAKKHNVDQPRNLAKSVTVE